jgi:hypothetical protein
MKKSLIIFALSLSILTLAQQAKPDDIWESIRFLEGTWEGTGDGMSGISSVIQEYQLVLNGQFLRMTTMSIFKPQEKNPEGEVHEDFGVFSFDSSRKVYVLGSFYSEGFVNQCVFNPVDLNENILNFVTEDVENAPPGTEAKLIFKKITEDKIEQSFHVAFPGQGFSCFSTNILQRKK